jgi:archaellum component FlaF (FlaF/FlaG flagellin family)
MKLLLPARLRTALFAAAILISLPPAALAQTYVTPTTNNPPHYGPWNAIFLQGGIGLNYPIEEHDTVQMASAPWTLYAWIQPNLPLTEPALIGGLGSTADEYSRMLAASSNAVILWDGPDNSLRFPLPAGTTITPGSWHFIAATFDGDKTFRVYFDGSLAGSGTLLLGSVKPQISLAPANHLPAGFAHYGGKVEGFTLLRHALSAGDLATLAHQRKHLDIVDFFRGSKDWPIQRFQWTGYREPQSPQQEPHSKAPFSKPVAQPLPAHRPRLTPTGHNTWTIGDWYLQAAPKVDATAAQIGAPGFSTASWLAATVPGTVLTTMVDRGIYPNPYYGLNNMAIPESLNKQDYWYRTTFPTPRSARNRQFTLTFNGINYVAHVWLNDHSLGSIKGAFIRGIFNVTADLKPSGENVLLVHVDPPFHPGIPQEQSVLGGPGANGGIMELDGPTFMDTEGWDWIPAIRDRDTGIWQQVTLHATGSVHIGDPQIITTLPDLPSRTLADVRINAPLNNDSSSPVHATLSASFQGVSIRKSVTLPPGETTVSFTPAEYPQLAIHNPHLWWPNGYGKPNLYRLTLTVSTGRTVSDTKQLHFGIREVSYVLGLMTPDGQLKQFVYDPSRGDVAAAPVINLTHRGILQVPPQSPYPAFYPAKYRSDWNQWVESVTPAGLHSPALRPAPADYAGTRTFLVLMVNGVRIPARGGNWGMDDAMKNVSQAHLEPYFKLEQKAGIDIIRNWQGQDTEKTFYDLADKYGIMIWNDFWESTQNSNIEPENPALFLKNARDVILRFRNHPSIVAWCGRNEGVPQPIINTGLDKLVRTLDGTRYYTGSSNQVNLQVSGPYQWQNPVLYYTKLNRGFSMETGTPSMSTLESFKAWTPKPDQWPIDDVWAYHDWHQGGNGNTHPFMAAIQAMFGAPTSLPDFERKAQMLNYVDHRAIFEGMDAHLWQPNSGRLLWMTHPAWPSNMWEIYNYDYSAQASYYGVKEALQPLHVQLDLSNGNVQVLNTTLHSYPSLTVAVHAYSLTNQPLFQQVPTAQVASPSNRVVKALTISLPEYEARAQGVALIELTLTTPSGRLLSRNLYWLAADMADYRALDRLPQATITASASWTHAKGSDTVTVHLQNTGSDVVLQQKLTLLDASGHRILPAYYSNNYVSLLPGESRTVTIQYPATAATSAPHLTLRAWNLTQRSIPVATQ